VSRPYLAAQTSQDYELVCVDELARDLQPPTPNLTLNPDLQALNPEPWTQGLEP